MVRILHVVTIMNRNGLENRIMDIYRHIDREKIQFDFLTHRTQSGAFDEEITQLGGKIYHISRVTIKNVPGYFKELNNFFEKHREYQIVHSHVNTLSTWVLLAAKRAGIPVRIAHSRTWGAELNSSTVFKYFSRLFINIPTTHKFACSKQAGEWLFGKNGIKEPNYFQVIPNSIEIEKFKFDSRKRDEYRKKLDIKNSEVAIVHVGRFVPQKNHDLLLKMFARYKEINPQSKLFLIGEGDLDKKIDEMIAELKLTDRVVKLGQLPNVGDYLNAMDAFVFPSIFEGFGTVTIEAQCNGLPILASDSIPKETKVSDFQEFESNNNPPEVWANHLSRMIESISRTDGSVVVKEAGYDIRDTYQMMQDFYFEVTGES